MGRISARQIQIWREYSLNQHYILELRAHIRRNNRYNGLLDALNRKMMEVLLDKADADRVILTLDME